MYILGRKFLRFRNLSKVFFKFFIFLLKFDLKLFNLFIYNKNFVNGSNFFLNIKNIVFLDFFFKYNKFFQSFLFFYFFFQKEKIIYLFKVYFFKYKNLHFFNNWQFFLFFFPFFFFFFKKFIIIISFFFKKKFFLNYIFSLNKKFLKNIEILNKNKYLQYKNLKLKKNVIYFFFKYFFFKYTFFEIFQIIEKFSNFSFFIGNFEENFLKRRLFKNKKEKKRSLKKKKFKKKKIGKNKYNFLKIATYILNKRNIIISKKKILKFFYKNKGLYIINFNYIIEFLRLRANFLIKKKEIKKVISNFFEYFFEYFFNFFFNTNISEKRMYFCFLFYFFFPYSFDFNFFFFFSNFSLFKNLNFFVINTKIKKKKEKKIKFNKRNKFGFYLKKNNVVFKTIFFNFFFEIFLKKIKKNSEYTSGRSFILNSLNFFFSKNLFEDFFFNLEIRKKFLQEIHLFKNKLKYFNFFNIFNLRSHLSSFSLKNNDNFTDPLNFFFFKYCNYFFFSYNYSFFKQKNFLVSENLIINLIFNLSFFKSYGISKKFFFSGFIEKIKFVFRFQKVKFFGKIKEKKNSNVSVTFFLKKKLFFFYFIFRFLFFFNHLNLKNYLFIKLFPILLNKIKSNVKFLSKKVKSLFFFYLNNKNIFLVNNYYNSFLYLNQKIKNYPKLKKGNLKKLNLYFFDLLKRSYKGKKGFFSGFNRIFLRKKIDDKRIKIFTAFTFFYFTNMSMNHYKSFGRYYRPYHYINRSKILHEDENAKYSLLFFKLEERSKELFSFEYLLLFFFFFKKDEILSFFLKKLKRRLSLNKKKRYTIQRFLNKRFKRVRRRLHFRHFKLIDQKISFFKALRFFFFKIKKKIKEKNFYTFFQFKILKLGKIYIKKRRLNRKIFYKFNFFLKRFFLIFKRKRNNFYLNKKKKKKKKNTKRFKQGFLNIFFKYNVLKRFGLGRRKRKKLKRKLKRFLRKTFRKYFFFKVRKKYKKRLKIIEGKIYLNRKRFRFTRLKKKVKRFRRKRRKFFRRLHKGQNIITKKRKKIFDNFNCFFFFFYDNLQNKNKLFNFTPILSNVFLDKLIFNENFKNYKVISFFIKYFYFNDFFSKYAKIFNMGGGKNFFEIVRGKYKGFKDYFFFYNFYKSFYNNFKLFKVSFLDFFFILSKIFILKTQLTLKLKKRNLFFFFLIKNFYGLMAR